MLLFADATYHYIITIIFSEFHEWSYLAISSAGQNRQASLATYGAGKISKYLGKCLVGICTVCVLVPCLLVDSSRFSIYICRCRTLIDTSRRSRSSESRPREQTKKSRSVAYIMSPSRARRARENEAETGDMLSSRI